MGKKQGKDMVKCNFFVNGFMNISMERSEILFHFCKNITLKCHHLHHFPLLSTSLSPNSSTKDSRIKKFYATEYTGYSEYIYVCVFIHTLNISDHFWSSPGFWGWIFSFCCWVDEFLSLQECHGLEESLAGSKCPSFSRKACCEASPGSTGWTSVSRTTPQNWFKLKRTPAKTYQKPFFTEKGVISSGL